MKKQTPNNKVTLSYALWIVFWTFAISVLLSVIFMSFYSMGMALSVSLLLLFVALGIVFDILGLAVATCSEAAFHSMATRRVKGAKESLWLIRQRDKVSNFCNDVIGDITGVVSGTTAVMIASNLANYIPVNTFILQVGLTGFVSGLMVGGKAIGKNIGIYRSREIVTVVGKMMYFIGLKKEIK